MKPDKKKRKQRIYRHTNSLKKAPIIEPNEYYKSDKNMNLSYVDGLHVKVNGITYGKTIELLDKEKQLSLELQNTVKGAIYHLNSIFTDYECNTSNIELNALIHDISLLNIIHPKKEYTGYKLVGGYVIGLGYDIIMEVGDIPEDFDKGYWTVINGEWILDEDKYNQLWSGVL